MTGLAPRILLVEDDEGTRERVLELLRLDLPQASLEAVGSAEEGLTRVRASGWDLLILDNGLPGISGLAVLPQLLEVKPDLPILMLSAGERAPYAKIALRLGARAYLEKQRISEELVSLIRQVLTS